MDGEEPQPIVDMEGAAADMEGMDGDMDGMDGDMDAGMDGDMAGMDDMDGDMDDMEGDADAPVVGMDDEQAEMSEAPSDAAGHDHSKDPSKYTTWAFGGLRQFWRPATILQEIQINVFLRARDPMDAEVGGGEHHQL